MKIKLALSFILFAALCFCANHVPLQAHNVFKKVMDQKYDGLKINCNACHVEGEDKKIRNVFGQLFHRELESENLTEAWNSKRGKERREFEQEVMTPAFEKALGVVSKMTYEDIIKSGLVDGMEKKEQASIQPPLSSQMMFVSLIASGMDQQADRTKKNHWKTRSLALISRKTRKH